MTLKDFYHLLQLNLSILALQWDGPHFCMVWYSRAHRFVRQCLMSLRLSLSHSDDFGDFCSMCKPKRNSKVPLYPPSVKANHKAFCEPTLR